MIEQIDTHDIKIRSKYLDLRLRPESIMVTRLFSEMLNLPFTMFVVKDKNIVVSYPTKLKTKNNTVYFDTKDLTGSISSQVDSLLFQIQSYGSRIGIMWPSHRSDCYFADEIRSIDTNFTTTGKFKTTGSDPTSIDISAPLIHMVDKTCMTVHSLLQEPMEFCFFYHNGMPYWNATTDDMLQMAFRPCSSRRDGLSMYYDRHGKPEQISISGHLGVEQMKRCLYNNRAIVTPGTEVILEHPQKIQEVLNEYKIKNCIIGSLAMRLHGFDVEAQDFDIIVDSLDKVKKCFKLNKRDPMEISESHKWSFCGARLDLKGLHADFVELPRFDWNQVEKKHGLNILSISGLLFMKLAGEYERMQMEPNYDNFQLKNHANIDLLLRRSPFVYPFFDEFLEIHSMTNYMLLQNQLEGAVWDSVQMKINEPLVANVFSKEGFTLLPVINNGSEISAKIHLQRRIKSAQWFQIGHDPVDCSVNTHSDWSNVASPEVKSLGLLVCQNA